MRMQGHPTGTGLTLEQKKSRLWGSKTATEQPQVKALHSMALHIAALKATAARPCPKLCSAAFFSHSCTTCITCILQPVSVTAVRQDDESDSESVFQ